MTEMARGAGVLYTIVKLSTRDGIVMCTGALPQMSHAEASSLAAQLSLDFEGEAFRFVVAPLVHLDELASRADHCEYAR